MNEQEIIEEMARDIIGGCDDCSKCPLKPRCLAYEYATKFYNSGCRKVVMCCECKYCEVVIDSIIDEPKWFCTRTTRSMPVDPTDYCSRAKMKGAE